MWDLLDLGDDDNFQKEDSALPRPYRNINLGQNALSAPQESGIFGPGPGRYSLAQAVVDHKAGSYAAPGLWQIGFGLSDIKIWDRIEYSLGLAYGQGTYNHELPQEYRMGLTTKDSYLEARLDQRYQVYENLAAIMELGYATLDLDPEIWGPEKEEDAYLMTFGLSYEF